MKVANPPAHPAPKAPGETPRILPPPDSEAALAAVPPAHVGPFGPGPTSPASRTPRPRLPHTPRAGPRARTASAHTLGAGLGGHVEEPGPPGRPRPSPRPGPPSGPARPHAEAPPPTRPRRSHHGRRTHRDAGAPVPPAHAGLAAPPEHSRPGPPPGDPDAAAAVSLREGGGRLPSQLPRRLVSAPALATSAA